MKTIAGGVKVWNTNTSTVILTHILTHTIMNTIMNTNIITAMTKTMIITTIIYAALTLLSNVIYNALHIQFMLFDYVKLFQIGLPAVLSIYFGFFSSIIQSYVFIMLTMVYVKDAAASE